MNYYEHHLGDYLRDTAHLSMLEDGAYRRLLDAYYIREAPLPIAPRDVFRLVRAQTKQDREAIETVLREFFAETPEGWRHSRCDREISRFQDKQRKAKASAEARWSHRQPQSEGNANAYATAPPDAMRTHSEGNAPRARPQTPDTKHQTPPPPTPASGGGLGADDSNPGTTDRQPAPPDPDHRPPAEIPPQPAEAPTASGAICAALRKAGIQRTNPGHPTLAALVQAGATVEELVALVPQTTGKADPFAYLLAAAVGQRQRAAETAKTLAGTAPPAPAADPQAWRRNTRDVMAMAEQLGVKARPGEGLQPFTERIVGAWMRAGQPVLQPQRQNPQPQPQEAA